MKRLTLFFILVFLLVSNAQAQTADFIVDGEAIIQCANGELAVYPIDAMSVRVTCTDTTPPTPTPVPPTPTPPPVDPTQPYPDAPLCTSHDPTAWHGLWNGVDGCHYDHEHGANPADWSFFASIEDIFGQTISYPHETPNENLLKHGGYNYGGWSLPECVIGFGQGGFSSVLIEAHGMANEMGQQARNHSFYATAELCNEQGFAGFIAIGGHADFGQLVWPYKGEALGPDVFPKAPEPYDPTLPPYVGLQRAANPRSHEVWNSVCRTGTEPFVDCHLFGYAFRINDPTGAWQPQGIFLPRPGNSSSRSFYQAELDVSSAFSEYVIDGLIQYDGYTDLKGYPAPDCVQASDVCVPALLIDVIPGYYASNITSIIGLSYPDSFYEGDIYFNGLESGWIGEQN